MKWHPWTEMPVSGRQLLIRRVGTKELKWLWEDDEKTKWVPTQGWEWIYADEL